MYDLPIVVFQDKTPPLQILAYELEDIAEISRSCHHCPVRVNNSATSHKQKFDNIPVYPVGHEQK